MTPELSVIIATRNRAQQLRDCLEAVARQETRLPASPQKVSGAQAGGAFTYEVIVADNGSTDATRQVVEALRATYPVELRYLYEGRVGKPWALNAALRQARGQLVAFTDDDALPAPGWLSALWVCAQEEAADGIGGRILPKWAGERPGWMTDTVAPAFIFGALGCVDHGPQRLLSTRERPHYWVGASLAMRREALEDVGGFDVRMARAQDTELQGRCLRAGKKVVYEPQALVYHTIGSERLTADYFRGWWHRRGYYAALRSPWKLHHLVTVEPLGWYRDVCRLSASWLAAVVRRRPWGERFLYEVRLRERASRWLQRAKLLPRMWGALFTDGWRLLGGQMSALDLQRRAWGNV